MTKEEVIKQAYGDYWETVKDYVNNNGWCSWKWCRPENIAIRKSLNEESNGCGAWRPKSLKGLETNNGWIKIESEQDLPKDQTAKYDLCHISKPGYLPNESLYFLKAFWMLGTITHYQPTLQKEKPLY